jgi:hypothetical protein
MFFVKPRFDPAVAMALSKFWILLSEIPGVLRRLDLLMEPTKMIGHPRMVVEGTLAGRGPIWMLFHSPNYFGILNSVLLLPPGVPDWLVGRGRQGQGECRLAQL